MDLKSGNPALSVKTLDGLGESADPMTLSGTVNKAAILLAILLIGAGWVWNLYFASHAIDDVMIYLAVGAIGGFVVALVTIFNKPISPTSPDSAAGDSLHFSRCARHERDEIRRRH